MEERELKRLGVDVYKGLVFTDWHVREQDMQQMMPLIFMPLIFIDKKILEDMKENCGMIYEYMDKALPRSVNGYPIFGSFRWIKKDEVEVVRKVVNEMCENETRAII